MNSSIEATDRSCEIKRGKAPVLATKKIGIVSRDYNKDRDFSEAYGEILEVLDREGCDTAVFSLFSIIRRKSFDPTPPASLSKLKWVLFEEFDEVRFAHGKTERRAPIFTVQYRQGNTWNPYRLQQVFGSITKEKTKKILEFVSNEMPHRVLGNACILLCGETNGVKYSKATKSVEDPFGLRRSIPQTVEVVLNPVHDRMTRFEMKRKRKFLSMGKRWTISVWNKGRKGKDGKRRDGKDPAWTIFRNGRSMDRAVKIIAGPQGFEIGVIDVSQHG